jgi:signal peptidase I
MNVPDDTPKSISYTGPSMNPTLKAPEKLHVVPYKERKIKRGDVVVFFSPESHRMVVHRVISVDARGCRTRGDYNRDSDTWILGPERIVGRVVSAQLGNRRRTISGGMRGLLYSSRLRAIYLMKSKIYSLLGPTYHRLAGAGLLRRWLPWYEQSRVVSFHRPAGTELQLLIGRRVIGRLLPGRREWEIRPPFRLLVDEAKIPGGAPPQPEIEELGRYKRDVG